MYSKVERWNSILEHLTEKFNIEMEYHATHAAPIGCDKQSYIRGLEQGRYLIREWFKSVMDTKGGQNDR